MDYNNPTGRFGAGHPDVARPAFGIILAATRR
jgi:hypothetical protein